MLLDFNTMLKAHNMDVTGVIHIGGHHGQEYDTYKECESIDKMVFFDVYNACNVHIMHSKHCVTIINKALGPFTCKADMNKETANEGQSNSILDPGIHLQQYPNITFEGKYEVTVHPLDKYEPHPSLNMINIDVQGFELQVFLGATSTLKNVKYIFTEVNNCEVYKNCALVEDLDYFLGKYNFSRVETTWDGQTWGDALYIKK